jgi:arylsulfatase A-like enzyme
VSGTPRAGGEARFAGGILLAAGVALAAFGVGIDRLAGEETRLGLLQVAALAAGMAMALLGGGLLASERARDLAARLWPFGVASPETPERILGFAVWLAGLTALFDVGLRFLQDQLGQRWASLNPHAGWMTPVSYGAVFLIVAATLALFAASGWRHLGSPRLGIFVLLLIAVASPLSVYESELHWLSIALLSLGIAVRGSSFLAGKRAGLARVVRASSRPLAFLVALVAVAPFAWGEASERTALSRLPDAPPDAPNVLLIVLDTVRAQNLSLYGYVRETTPRLEALALTAMVYDRAVAPSSWTLPSHASMFTGVPPHRQSGNFGRPLDETLPTLAEALRDRGWYTLGVVANYANAFPHTGLDRGFLRYDAGVATADEMLLASSAGRVGKWLLERFGRAPLGPTRKNADVVNERFLDFLAGRGERPFFAFLNYYDAHFPFDSPLPPETLIPDWTRPEIPLEYESLMDRVDQYDREIAFLDDRVGRLLDELDGRGILDRTIVIVASDHGEEFSEHGRTGHGWNVYDTSLWVPLLIRYPSRVPGGARVGGPVSLQDLPATVMALTGHPDPDPFPGQSLIPLPGETLPAPPVLSELSGTMETPVEEIGGWDQRSLVWDALHYIRLQDGSEELYDLAADPWETRDLAGLPAGKSQLARFRAALARLVDEVESGSDGDLAAVGRGEPERER